jgi:hypothetical protein
MIVILSAGHQLDLGPNDTSVAAAVVARTIAA